jgi:UDP-galactopyranose mutase
MARIADFTNFSKQMSKENEYPLTLEYFCFEKDDIWSQENSEIIAFALKELKTIFNQDFNIIHNEVTRNANAYPVIKTGYEKDINIIKNWLKTKENLTAIGRSGMFKYNNQDHAMATGLYAVRTLLGEGNFDPWSVNVDGEYHEEISNN